MLELLLKWFTKPLRGAVTVSATKEKAEYDLSELTLCSKRRAARQRTDGRHVQTGGIIRIRNAGLRLEAKDFIQKKKDKRTAKRVVKAVTSSSATRSSSYNHI